MAATISTRTIHRDWFSTQHVQPRRTEFEASRLKTIGLPLTLFAVLLVQLCVRITIIEKGYELEELRRESLEHDELLRAKRLEWATHSRPAALSEEAERRLGLIRTMPQRVRRLP